MRWVLGLHGLVSVVFGVMILAWPGISVYALTIVFGAYTLATGIVEFGTAFTAQGREERGWLILQGPPRDHRRRAGLRLARHLGARAPVRDRRVCRRVRDPVRRRVVRAAAGRPRQGVDGPDGPVAIAFGIVIFAKPGAGALAVLALIAAFGIVTGISELVVAIGGEELLERKAKRLRVAGGEVEDAPAAVALTVDLHDCTSAEPATTRRLLVRPGDVSRRQPKAAAWHRPWHRPATCIADTSNKEICDDYDSN